MSAHGWEYQDRPCLDSQTVLYALEALGKQCPDALGAEVFEQVVTMNFV